MRLGEILERFEKVIPLSLQEEWDHGGLNLGSRTAEVRSVLFAYDVCRETVEEASRLGCGLIVSHHPFRMKADVNIALDEYEGRLIASCIQKGIALYSCHTAHDRSRYSLNRVYLCSLGLKRIRALVPAKGRSASGTGAVGVWPKPLAREKLISLLKRVFRVVELRWVDGGRRLFRLAGIVTGSGAGLIPRAARAGCDVFITGDVKYHAAIDAKRYGLSVADVGHFPSEIASAAALRRLFMGIFGTRLKLHVYGELKDAFERV